MVNALVNALATAVQTLTHSATDPDPTAPALFFYVRFDHGLLDAVDGECVGAVA